MLAHGRVLLALPVGHSVPQLTPDVGLGFLATALRAKGFTVTILDCVCEKFGHDDFSRYVESHDFGAIGIKLFSSQLESGRRMLETIRRVSPGTITLLGGPHPSGSPEDVLSEMP